MDAMRRLAATLVDSSAPLAACSDEVGIAGVLREHRVAAEPLIAEHRGRVVKTTGDGVLLEFGSIAVYLARPLVYHG